MKIIISGLALLFIFVFVSLNSAVIAKSNNSKQGNSNEGNRGSENSNAENKDSKDNSGRGQTNKTQNEAKKDERVENRTQDKQNVKTNIGGKKQGKFLDASESGIATEGGQAR